MRPDLADLLNCPARGCGSQTLSLEAHQVEEVAYRTGTIREVREGELRCPQCEGRYPIRDYVPSFEEIFPAELREEARYWSDWYGFFWDKGYRGFFDLRAPSAHLIARGIEVYDPHSLGGADLPGTHQLLAEHPLVRGAGRVLDIGCGCGWSSLYLARRGHGVVAFDPSVDNVTRAKLYAISHGEYVEYLGAAVGYLSFKPGVFDALFALHSIHHVPNLKYEVTILRDWLRDGGTVAVDEHIQTDPTLDAVRVEIDEWFTRKVANRYITIDRAGMEGLPRSSHSALEDVGGPEVLGAFIDNFSIDSLHTRFVSLDLFSFMYYLDRDKDLEGFRHAGEVVHRLYGFLQQALPERAEYITIVGRKSSTPGPSSEELARELAALLGRGSGSEVLAGMPEHLLAQLTRETRHMRAELEALTHPEHGVKAALAAATEALDTLRATVQNLNRTVHDKDAHIAELQEAISRQQAELARKQAALDEREALLKRIESGRLMRLANRLTGRGRRSRAGGRGK